MANGIYKKFKEGLMNKEFDLDTDTISGREYGSSNRSLSLGWRSHRIF